MSRYDINAKLEELSEAWETFKDINDRRLTEIEQKGSASHMTTTYLDKLDSKIEECKNSITALENHSLCPPLSSQLSTTDNLELKHYLQKGETAPSISKGDKGGWPINGATFSYVQQAIMQYCPMRQLASTDYIKTNMVKCIKDASNLEATWADTFPPAANPIMQNIEIYAHDLKSKVQLHSKDLEDGFIDVDKWLLDKMIVNFAKAENKAFLYGTGNAEPRGICYDNSNETKVIYVGGLNYETLLSAYFALKDEYSKSAVFLMHRTTLQKIRSIKIENGSYLWQPSMDKSLTDTIMGIPVHTTNDLNPHIFTETEQHTVAKDPIIIFGDFKRGYRIVDRKEISIMRDPYTNAPYVNFLCTRRVGGAVVEPAAFVMVKIDNTIKV